MASATKVIGPSEEYTGRVKAGAVGTIGPNDIVIADPNEAGYVTIGGTGASEGDSDESFVGMAIQTSTETVSADGYVKFLGPPRGQRYLFLEMQAETPANLARAKVGTSVTLNGMKGSQTLNEDDTTKGIFQILDPADNKFDTSGGRMRVALPCIPWVAAAIGG